jgi:hypothetical protein
MSFQQDEPKSYTFRMTVWRPTFQARIGVLLLLCFAAPAFSNAQANALYSYTDEQGTRVITDNYQKIPPAYRAKVTIVTVPGMSLQQSKIITYAGTFALLCLLAMTLSRSDAVKALALWCLVLTGICAPVLVYTADDGAAAVMKSKAADIQQKQQDRLSHAQ